MSLQILLSSLLEGELFNVRLAHKFAIASCFGFPEFVIVYIKISFISVGGADGVVLLVQVVRCL